MVGWGGLSLSVAVGVTAAIAEEGGEGEEELQRMGSMDTQCGAGTHPHRAEIKAAHSKKRTRNGVIVRDERPIFARNLRSQSTQ